jgi:type I restriction enzyme S subunit
MKTKKIKDLFLFGPKSKIKAGDGKNNGRFPFYTSSPKQTKWIDQEQHFDEALIFGTGGLASVHFEDQPFSTSTDCIVAITNNKEIKTKFVYFYLFGNIHLLERGFKGAGLKHISKKYIENLDIPILPIETQNKIVSILDKASSLISKREISLTLLDELLKVIFLDMFGDAFSNSKNWIQEPLGENLDFITSGSRGWAQYYSETGDIFLRINNLGYNELLLNDIMYVTSPNSTEAIRTQIKEGDVLLSITADLGRTAVVPRNFPKAFVNQHIAILRPNKKINPYYLSSFISSIGGRQLLQKYSKGAAKSALNFPDIKILNISIPNINLQNKFEQDCLFIIDEKEKLIKSKIELELLFKSIIQKVFNGQLNFNVDFELDSLVKEIDLQKKENDLSKITGDIAYLQRLVDKLNNQEFKEKDLYDRAKHGAFQLMAVKEEERKVIQEYDENSKSLKLALK